MARTRGAKDKQTRKKPAAKAPTMRQSSPGQTPGPKATTVPAIDRAPLPPDDFKAAIAAELQQAPSTGTPGSDQVSPQTASAPAAFDPTGLTLDGLASAWQVPFWALGWVLKALRVIPSAEPVMEVGKRRAKDLAKPSYEIYAHYARQYLQLNPENTVHVAAGVTGLNAVGILPDLTEAIVKSRRAWLDQVKRAQQVPPAGGPGQ